MEFIKHFNHVGRNSDGFKGTAVFGDGTLTIRLPNKYRVVDNGFIEGGFGVVVETQTPKKSPYVIIKTEIDMNYLPPELRGKNYKFRINATYLSDTEIAFMYKDAMMLTHK